MRDGQDFPEAELVLYEAVLIKVGYMSIPSQNSSRAANAEPRIPQRKRGRARVAALLKAGAEVFSEKGYEAATMTEIAASAGASIGSLYQFFPTKELLARALHETYLADLSAMLEELRHETAGQGTAELADCLFDQLQIFLAKRPAFSALAERRDIDKEQKRRTGAALREQIAGLLASTSPPFPEARCEALAAVILQLMKAAVTLNSEEGTDRHCAIQLELRQMLKGHLNSVQVA